MNSKPYDPLYAGPRLSARGQFSTKPPLSNGDPTPRLNGRTEETTESNQNRAARYEDEKRRIVESCFAKKEDDGVAAESYITHVRVTEDSAYPSAPPPPESSPTNKKSRVILVAVKRTGRVRVHKARENPTGTFSIGKTWNLEELSSIQSFANLIPRSHEEELHKSWAGGFGFIITLQKAYYWQAPTTKEKEFFIGSLVKIYRKYTGGKLPELVGFAGAELDLLTGTPVSPNLQLQSQIPPLSAQPLSPPPPIPASNERRPLSPQSLRSQSSEASRARTQSRGEQGPPARDAHRPPPIEPLRSPIRNDEGQTGQDNRSQRSFDSATRAPPSEKLPYTPTYLQVTNPRPSPSPQSSQQSLPFERVNGRATNGATRPPQPPYPEYGQYTPGSTHSGGSRPSTAVSEQKSVAVSLSDSPPDRRRPFMGKQDSYLGPRSGAASETNSQFATPAATPSDLREEIVPEFPLINQTQASIPIVGHQSTEPAVHDKSQPSATFSNMDPTQPPVSIYEQSPAVQLDHTSPETASTVPPPEESHRPGLGPMIKKKSAKDIAGQFRRAALAATAFQPRQGGAGARLKALQDKDKLSDEPDGITSVVPAPLFRGMSSDTVKSSTSTPPATATIQEPIAPSAAQDVSQPIPAANSAAVTSETPPSIPLVLTPETTKPEVRSPSPERPRTHSPERKRRQRQEADITRYCAVLGIDPSIFQGKGADFNDLLSEFGWEGKLAEHRPVEEFEADIKREIGRAQATGWLGHVEQQETKVQDLAKAFDKAIEECEELDGLFTLYSHELDTLAADIEYIEAQSQGLQVQTANQKLLQNELNNLLRTLTIPSSDLRGLQMGSLDTETGVETAERSLALVYKALITIDPDIRQNKIRQTFNHSADRGGVGVYADTEIGQMRAVLEKKAHYQNAAMGFVQRYNQHITAIFKAIDDESLAADRQKLWTYNAMMLFVREVNSFEWQTLISSYEISLKGTYQTQFRDHTMNQRRLARKSGSEELEALFTTQEKEKPDETLAITAARKLTVKRGKTVKASALRHQLGEKQDGKLDPYEIFAAVLKHQGHIISEEQNFIVSFFHLNSLSSADFTEMISRSPNQRRLPNLSAKQSYDPDRNMAKIVQGVVEGIYSFWLSDLQNLVDWALGADALQGIGLLVGLEQCLAVYEETNQEYITRTVRTLHERLTGLFHKFVDEQIKAIEETKVKVKRRKGVISFMRTFPLFSAVIEQMLPAETSSAELLEVRFILNEAYSKILKAMWESLSFIAKDDPAAPGGGLLHPTLPTGGDPEDKEALNYHILLIENMNYYLEEVDTLKNVVLEEWADKARQDLLTHLTQYTDSVIRRPLGKWLDYIESTEASITASETGGLRGKQSHSRSTVKKVLSSHDSKEIKKGIETLKKRIEKHFGDTDDVSAGNKVLIAKVLEECSARYAAAHSRMQVIIDRLHEGTLNIDWSKEEVAALFKR